MSRPQPKIIMTDPGGRKDLEVCRATAVYAVFYDSEPIKVRTRDKDAYGGFKYKRTSFPEPGHAIALARRLNRQFATQGFTVHELRSGKHIPLM